MTNIADRVKTIPFGFHPAVRRHMSGVGQLDMISQKPRVGMHADVNEKTGKIDMRIFSRRRITHAHAGNNIIAENFVDNGSIARNNLRVLQRPLSIGMLRLKLFAVVKNQHSLGVIRQRKLLLQCRVAAADDSNDLTILERPIATRAVADPVAGQFLLAGHAELLERRACGDNDGFGAISVFGSDDRPETIF